MIAFRRILVKREKLLEKPSWEEKTWEDEIKERTFTLVDCGFSCDVEIKQMINSQVLLSDTKGIKTKEEDNFEYFILPQETILCRKD
mgnify:CR=1 FL=1